MSEQSEGASTSAAMPSGRRFACRGQNCGKTFKSMSSRSNHMKKCAEALKTSPKKLAKKKGERFSCRFCNKGFNSQSSCYRHQKESCAASSLFRGEPVKLKKKKGKSEFPCQHCSRVFDRSKKLEKHIEVKHTDRTLYNCCNCGRDFRRNDFFQKHLQICQGSNELPTFVEFRRNTDMTSENSTDPHSVVEEVIYNADSSCDDTSTDRICVKVGPPLHWAPRHTPSQRPSCRHTPLNAVDGVQRPMTAPSVGGILK